MNIESLKITPFDERRQLLIPGDETLTLDVCVRHFISSARAAIEDHGAFYVALSGGNTPKKIFSLISQSPHKEKIDWEKVWLFWGDERNVPLDDEKSNYKMAMDSGLGDMPIPREQIFRMKAEDHIEENALEYEQQMRNVLGERSLDLVMLGMGEDGHTASLFPQTEGLKAENRLVIANYIPQKNTWRMSLTFEAINRAHGIVIYVMGVGKKQTLVDVLTSEEDVGRYPIQKVGTKENQALWIIDDAAAAELIKQL